MQDLSIVLCILLSVCNFLLLNYTAIFFPGYSTFPIPTSNTKLNLWWSYKFCQCNFSILFFFCRLLLRRSMTGSHIKILLAFRGFVSNRHVKMEKNKFLINSFTIPSNRIKPEIYKQLYTSSKPIHISCLFTLYFFIFIHFNIWFHSHFSSTSFSIDNFVHIKAKRQASRIFVHIKFHTLRKPQAPSVYIDCEVIEGKFMRTAK